MEKQLIIIAEEFPPHPGGVSYFAGVLAKKYHDERRLKGVISLSKGTPQVPYPLLQVKLATRKYGSSLFDRFIVTRKLKSAIFRLVTGIKKRIAHPVADALKKLGYDPASDVLFFTYQVHHPALFAEMQRRFGGKQWILYHGLDLLGFRKYPAAVISTCASAEKVIFNSEATRKLFHEIGFSAPRQEVMRPFLDKEHLATLRLKSVGELQASTGLTLQNVPVVISVCRLVKRKGIHFAIEIVDRVIRRTGTPICYIVVGDGPEAANLRLMAQQKKLGDNIHFLGHVDDVTKYSLLKVSRVFMMPNYDDGGNDFEGFGISFLEAAYFGNCVMGGNHGGAVEALDGIPGSYRIDVDDDGIDKASRHLERLIRENVSCGK